MNTAENPSDVVRRFDFFESHLLRIVYRPEEHLLDTIAVYVWDHHGGRRGEVSFVRLLFVGVSDFERSGGIAKPFAPHLGLNQMGGPNERFPAIYWIKVRGDLGHRHAELVISDVGEVRFRFDQMLWDLRKGKSTKDAKDEWILFDAESGGKFEFYDPFPDS